MKQIHPEYTNPSYNSNISPLFGSQENQNENKKTFFENIILHKKKKKEIPLTKFVHCFVYLLLDLNFRIPILKKINK